MRSTWWPLAAITLGNFMLLIDVTIVNTALPQVAHGLDASFTSLQWVMDIYALALAALLMVAGSAADLFGRRRLYLLGLTVFALSSLICGLAPDAGVLIAARAVQGIGAAAMFATNTPLLMATYSGRARGVVGRRLIGRPAPARGGRPAWHGRGRRVRWHRQLCCRMTGQPVES